MKSVFLLFWSDIKSILSRPYAIFVILVLMVMPGFYAWFNIVASWNPYGNTKNIKVAIANEDAGVDFL